MGGVGPGPERDMTTNTHSLPPGFSGTLGVRRLLGPINRSDLSDSDSLLECEWF